MNASEKSSGERIRERISVTSRLMINFLLIRTGLIPDATVMRRFRCIQYSRRGGIRGFLELRGIKIRRV
jgi:hypothetical protein